ncbi:MAG: S8 family serine peptidase [Solirubrobacteraceae bacterium]|nr:S8 family serine peptidase [Solirubrobacteraceae bacterium]
MPRNLLVLPIVLAVALGATAAPANAASSPFAPVSRSITQSKKALGPKATKDLSRRVSAARTAQSKRRYCTAIKELGGVVTATKRLKGSSRKAAGATVASQARTVQRKLFLQNTRRGSSCGLAKPKVKVSAKVDPTKVAVPNAADGKPRTLSAFEGGGAHTDFVANELVVTSNDKNKVTAFAKRWSGKVLEHRDRSGKKSTDTFLIRIDPSAADPDDLPDDLKKLDPLSRGTTQFSDTKGLKLFAVSADAVAHGLTAVPNALFSGDAVENRSTTEATSSAGGWSSDGYAPWYNVASGTIGTGEAWRTLKISGKDKNRVKVAIVDGGFFTSSAAGDLGTSPAGDWGTSNNLTCGPTNPCPFHGTNVASAAGGIIDNGAGVAGSGGQVADLRAVSLDGSFSWDIIDGIYEAFESGAKVINMSNGMPIPAVGWFVGVAIEDATQTARENGALVVASAGNNGIDVDAEDCFIACWEENWIAPCENDAVVCVGGIDSGGTRNPQSNFGFEWTENAKTSDVDIFAPWTTWVGGDPANSDVHQVSGTSFSAPFVSGVAAMMLAVDPSLSPAKLEEGLRKTATSSTDPNVSRIVDAEDAVRWAFQGKHIPPLAQIDTVPGLSPYGSLNLQTMSASALTVLPDPGCCSYSWSSDVDGPIGTGPTISYGFPSSGDRKVTVTVKDSQGGVSTATRTVSTYNLGPDLTVVKPAAGAQLYRGQTYKFEAKATDPNEFAGVKCEGIGWTVKKTGSPDEKQTGCQPAFSFSSNGARTLDVLATDEVGMSAGHSRNFTVVDPPLNAPPLVAIVTPDDNAFLDPGTTYTLKATAVDPDNVGVTSTSWSVKVGSSAPVVLGTGLQRSWKPSNNVPSVCGTQSIKLIFSATDANGTSTDEISASVNFGPC